MMRHYPDLGSASDWLKKFSANHNSALPRPGYSLIISMEFLLSFLGHNFVGKPVVALPRNVGCLLRTGAWKVAVPEIR